MKLITSYDLLVIVGPTASGKTSLAAAIANKIGGEIVSADSRQVYRDMNLGTGKDYNDYVVDDQQVPYHLIDIVDPGYKYNVFEYQRDFILTYNSLKERKVFPVVCGGSGMYLESVISGYKMAEVLPDSGLRQELEKKTISELKEILSIYKNPHNTTDIDTKKRVIRAIEIEHYSKNTRKQTDGFPKLNSLVVGILTDRDSRRKRITERLNVRLKNGMIDEVKQLIDIGVDTGTLIYYGLEYKYITLFLTGLLPYEKMVRDLEIAIHQFAKRQMTWFRGMERRGIKIHWLEGDLPLQEKVRRVIRLLSE